MQEASRTKKSFVNVSYGLIVTVLNTLLSFVFRTVFVNTLGADYLGINGLFNEIIAVISLSELGVGMAIVYSLYKPLREGDNNKISKLINLYRDAYNIIAVVTLIIGLMLLPFVHFLVTDIDYSSSYIRLVFFLFVLRTSTSYIFAYKGSLLNADQKQYIVSLITCIVKYIFLGISVAVLLLTQNYIAYLVIMIVQGVMMNFAISCYVDRHYLFLNNKAKLAKADRKEIFADVKNIFIKRLSGVITSSTDNILISKIVSTKLVGYYSNYVLILSMVRMLKQQITSGVAASIGDLVASADYNLCRTVLKRLTFIYFCVAVLFTNGFLAVSDAFISLWLGSGFTLSRSVVLIIAFNLFIEVCSDPLWQFMEVSGLFYKDKNIGVFGSIVNLFVSVVLGKAIGISGIFIGTLSTQIIQLFLKTKLIYKELFKESAIDFFKIWFRLLVVIFLTIFVEHILYAHPMYTNNIIEFIVKGFSSVFISVLMAGAIFYNTEEQKYLLQLIKKRKM